MFWNLHEPRPGVFDFSGQLDVGAYIRTAQEVGLRVILRPGPYVCSEWDLGGLPAWLLADPAVVVRGTDPRFMTAARLPRPPGPQTTSYDYDAALDESGRLRQPVHVSRRDDVRVHERRERLGRRLAVRRQSYGYVLYLTGIANLADFIGGSFSIDGFTETILAVTGSDVYFRADKTSFMPGQARLMQDPKHPALWSKVAAFAIANLPVELVFTDPLPPPAGTAVDSYCARLAYYGRLGPAGNIVRSTRSNSWESITSTGPW